MLVDEKVRIEKLRLALQDIADVSSLGLEGGKCMQWFGHTAKEALQIDDEDQKWGS